MTSHETLSPPPLVDIAVNLTDCVFRGVDWKGRTVHDDDFDAMVRRAQASGVRAAIISGTCLVQCHRALRLCRRYPGFLFITIGVHPANAAEFLLPIPEGLLSSSPSTTTATASAGGAEGVPSSPSPPPIASPNAASPLSVSSSPPEPFPFGEYTVGGPVVYNDLPATVREACCASGTGGDATAGTFLGGPHDAARLAALEALIVQNPDVVVAVGECGLDGAETQYCPLEVQRYYFIKQLELAQKVGLPLFLHSRDCGMRFIDLYDEFYRKDQRSSDALCPAPVCGVVHSFTGGPEELRRILGHPQLFVGLNGSAFRTEASARLSCGAADCATNMKSTDNQGVAERAEGGGQQQSPGVGSAVALPLSRVVLETDAPWCDIRPDHFGMPFVTTTFPTVKKEKFNKMVRGGVSPGGTAGGPPTLPCVERRVEPCHMRHVLEAYAGAYCHFHRAEQATAAATAAASANPAAAVGHAPVTAVPAPDAVQRAFAAQIMANTLRLFPRLAAAGIR